MRSLKATLIQRLAVALFGMFIVLEIAGGYAIRRLVEDYVVDQMEHTVNALLADLIFDENGAPALSDVRIMPVYRQPFSGHYYRIQSDAGELRSRSLWDEALPVVQAEPGQLVRSWAAGPQQQVLLIVSAAFRKQDRHVVISVGEDFSPVLSDIRALQWWSAILGLAVLGFAIWLQWQLIQRGLAPLQRLREEIRSLKRGETRTIGADAPEEVAPLVTEINRLTDLTVQRLERSRNALGNVAHALKTPLTVLTQLARHPDLAERPELVAELSKQTQLIHERIDRELKRARIAGSSAPGHRVGLAVEVRDLVATLQKIYDEKSIEIVSEIAADILFPGDRGDLLELLGNLMDNACKWAAQRVRVSAMSSGDVLTIAIEDDGPGIPAEQLDQLPRRGGRVDESREGHGLGLAIVRDIIDQYRGRVAFARSKALGGLRVELEFPVAKEAD